LEEIRGRKGKYIKRERERGIWKRSEEGRENIKRETERNLEEIRGRKGKYIKRKRERRIWKRSEEGRENI
jgi:hypothetical protein